MRKLSAFEGSYVSRSDHKIYYNFIIGAEYTISLSKDIVLNTVAKLCSKYPQFSLRIDGYNSIYAKPYTVNDSFIEVLETGTVAEICEKYTLHKFIFNELDKPLFKLIYVIDINSIFFVADHTYFDGTSGKNFHIQFANELQNDNTKISRFIDTTNFPKFPDPTKLLNFQTRYKAGKDSKSWMPKLNSALLELPMPVHRTTMINFNSEKTQKLLQFTRLNDIKLTAFLQAIGAKCISDLYNSDGLFKTLIAVNARPYIAGNEIFKEFGILFGKYVNESTVESIKSTELIKLSQTFQNSLDENKQNAINGAEILETLAINDYSIIEKEMDKLAAANNKPSISYIISNLGNVDSPIINKVFFDQAMVDGSFALHICSCSKGGMMLNFTSHRAIDKDVYQKYVESFTNTLYKYL